MSTLSAIHQRMTDFGANTAPMPVSMSQALNEGGELVWMVDLHIRVRGVTEFEISAEGATLAEALRGAYLGMNNRAGLIKNAQRANDAFGIAV